MAKTRTKIALIGAGNIGGELAALCAREELGDVTLFDIKEKENFAKGKALDLEQNGAILGYDRSIKGSADPADLEGTDVCIITAGFPRKPGQSRADLIGLNHKIMKQWGEYIGKYAPNAFVIVITNPVDAMVYAVWKASGLPASKVVGMAGVLDSARFQLFVARALGVATKDVRAMVLGGHGDDMVPIVSATTVNGIPVTQLMSREALQPHIDRTRKGGGEIVNLMGTSAYYAPATAAVTMARAYLRDEKRLLAAAAYCNGEYGYKDMFCGVPCVIGAGGVEKIHVLSLTDEEKAMLEKSAKSVREQYDEMNKQ
jgi:malate dehydrogenase